MGYKYKLKEFEVGDVKVDNGTKSTVTDIDSTTGAISWSIQQIPNIDKLVEDVDELTSTAKKVYQKTKDDKKFLDIYEQARSLRNVIRTHVRNNYPDDYKKAMRENMNEESSSVYKMVVDLILNAKSRYPVYYNTSRGWVNVGGTGYQGGDLVTIFKAKQGQSTNIKNVFYKAAQTPNETKKEVERLSKGKISVDLEGKGDSAILKYNLREEEEVDEMSTSGGAGGYLTPYAFRKKGAKADDEAYTELGYTVVDESAEQPGEDLGPGPKAGDEGVTDSAYTKQFKYKLVPKKNGTYVQKGSGMIVKNVF